MSFRAETRPPVMNTFSAQEIKKRFHERFGRFRDLHQRNSRGLGGVVLFLVGLRTPAPPI